MFRTTTLSSDCKSQSACQSVLTDLAGTDFELPSWMSSLDWDLGTGKDCIVYKDKMEVKDCSGDSYKAVCKVECQASRDMTKIQLILLSHQGHTIANVSFRC